MLISHVNQLKYTIRLQNWTFFVC